ncbi:homocysteine S-methyltransferase family protein [Litoreibacter janthinus]|uniref:Homocysteine S-methyltransferase n=1 Tax=Litoreibacter janthinus TaxID=670154 RepID=A0A1I6GK86_9RHOB|nr:homocysteine S-methyltransferase family protein [Litoreibacter janthinus]SFR42613.1 homocysteine S-methyltransferase [Litoreibacter janthinus]
MKLPHQSDCRYLAWTGMETDLIFKAGIDLPGFASFPLLQDPKMRRVIESYAREQIQLAARHGLGCVLESATWMANLDRAASLGYDASNLVDINRDAIALLADVREQSGAPKVLISANIGPRDDAYAPSDIMSAEDAEHYHTAQIESLVGTAVDMLSAYTFSNSPEAIGFVRSGRKAGFPSVVAFTVETDGRLPTGQTIDAAISVVDAATDEGAAYFMVNCAHPDHFSDTLTGNSRLAGIVVNASRCSHAELNEATQLDEGDPSELGEQIAALVADFPSIRVIGGCCGTDMRHLEEMASRVGGMT